MRFPKKSIIPCKGKVLIKLADAETNIVLAQFLITLRFGEGEGFAFLAGAELKKVLKIG